MSDLPFNQARYKEIIKEIESLKQKHKESNTTDKININKRIKELEKERNLIYDSNPIDPKNLKKNKT